MEILKRINKTKKEYWVTSNKIIFRNNNIYIDFKLKIENIIEKYEIICENIIEYYICDTDGGGINIWTGINHNALRQYIDDIYSLKIDYDKELFKNIFYEIYKLHIKKYKDWIPFDKYYIAVVNNKTKSEFFEIYHGPKFIANEYIKILKKHGIKYILKYVKKSEVKENIQMIHFGNSYIIANNIFDKRKK
jgi:hypothetical protein